MRYQIKFSADLIAKIKQSKHRAQILDLISMVSRDIREGKIPDRLDYYGKNMSGKPGFSRNGIILFCKIDAINYICEINGFSI